jgi:antitoxin component YwqK of YwqJK toxin-antitoxin module
MTISTFVLRVIVAIQMASAQVALADSTAISPKQIVERDFLVYQVGSSAPFAGSVISTRYDGSKDYEERYIDGRLHGARTGWDRSGNRVSETMYVNGAKTGPETFWYTSGQVMAITNFVDGGRHGLSSRWCENGQKRFEWSYANNMKNGVQTAWYPSGQKQNEGVFTDDRPSGRLSRWYENGQLTSDVSRDPDSQIVTSTIWYESGQKKCEGVFAKGESPTKTAWDESGNRLEIDEQAYLAYCNSSLGPAMLRPGERAVSVRSDPDGATRYGTVGNETTMTKVELSASDREKMKSIGRELVECGLTGAMSQ